MCLHVIAKDTSELTKEGLKLKQKNYRIHIQLENS